MIAFKNTMSTIYLVPAPLGPDWLEYTLPVGALATVRSLRHFAVENLRTARRYLAELGMPVPIAELTLELFDRESTPADAQRILREFQANDIGVISEAGVPGVADPGAVLVAEAQRKGQIVVPLVGPSSILLTLMGSGFNGQQFAFCGYLPIAQTERRVRIRQLEQLVVRSGQTQLFIETPYRNDAMLQQLLADLQPRTLLCLGHGLQHPEGWVRTRTVAEWRQAKPSLGKIPTVFALGR